jgi:hypothetical protein
VRWKPFFGLTNPRRSQSQVVTAMQSDARQIAERVNARRVGSGWMGHCPTDNHAHGDRSPSLSIAEGRDGRVLLHCFAGCAIEDICQAAGIEVRELFPAASGPRRHHEPAIVRAAERAIAELRIRLTPRERVVLEPTVITTTNENLDFAVARALALSVEGDLVQVVMLEGE